MWSQSKSIKRLVNPAICTALPAFLDLMEVFSQIRHSIGFLSSTLIRWLSKTCVPVTFSLFTKNKSPRNPHFMRFPRLFHNRGWENRTPAKSFGDSCHTIWPIPFILLFLFLFSFLVDDPPATLGNTLFIPYRHSFVNRLSVSLLYKRKWLHRHSLFSVPSKLHTFKSFLEIRLPVLEFLFSLTLTGPWSSPRPISSSQLHTLPYFHLCPIYLVVFKGSYCFRMGYLISRGASRLDAFSVYPFPAWLLCHALGRTTDTPAASPSRSSRTKDSSSQISYAHAG